MDSTENGSITGRDGYIIAQALAYASEMLRHLGEPFDEPSNRHDMDAILEANGANASHDRFRALARAMLHRDLEATLVDENGQVTGYKYEANDWSVYYEFVDPGVEQRATAMIVDGGGEIVEKDISADPAYTSYTSIIFKAPTACVVGLRQAFATADDVSINRH